MEACGVKQKAYFLIISTQAVLAVSPARVAFLAHAVLAIVGRTQPPLTGEVSLGGDELGAGPGDGGEHRQQQHDYKRELHCVDSCQ